MLDQQWESTADHGAPPAAAAPVWESTSDHSSAPKASPEDDLIRSYGYDPAVIKKAHLYTDNALSQIMAHPSAFVGDGEKPGLMSDALQGFTGTMMGLNQLASHGVSKLTGNPADAEYSDLLARVSKDAYAKLQPNPSTLATLAGQSALPVPGGAAKTVLGTIAKGALTGGAAAAMQPVDVRGPNGDYIDNKLMQAGTGAVVGGATGGLVGGVARGLSSRAVELPEEMNARVATEGADAAAKLESKMQATPFAGFAEVTKAAAAGDKSAQTLDAQMASAKTPAQVQQASLGLMNWRTRQTASGLYDKVEQAVAKHPELSDVPLDQTEQTISDALNQAQKAKDPDTSLINLLKTVQRNIGASADPAASDQLVDNSYGQIRKFRSDLGERIAAERTGAGKQLLGPSSAATLQGIRDAVDTDLKNFTSKAAPDVQKAADVADQYYAKNRVPFMAQDVAKAGAPNLAGTTTDAEADQIFGKFIQAGKGDKAQRFFNALDPKGRAAVQYQIATDAINQATDPAEGTFDPKKFFNALDDVKGAYGVFLTGPDKALMDGLKNLAQQSVQGRSAEAARALSLTKVAGGLGAAGVVANATGAQPVAAGLGLMAGLLGAARGLMFTAAGRRLLTDAASLKPGDPAMARIYEAISKQLPAAAGRVATQ